MKMIWSSIMALFSKKSFIQSLFCRSTPVCTLRRNYQNHNFQFQYKHKVREKNLKLSENHLPLLNINSLEFIILRAPANLNPAREVKLIEFLAGHDLFGEFQFECETNAK